MKSQQGFTLIEVLVALTLVAVALGAGMRAAGAVTDNAERFELMTAAQWCAENHLVELRLTRQFPGTGESAFNCLQMGREFQGRLEVQTTPNPNFRRVDAVVGTPDRPNLLRLSTVMGRNG
ncbi:type II secretion system minor pseudopilin GspI [Inhella gelatinilytica]|uniref:Type II secretion system protein I n=1 Tax=Inhella gelatinilytica TaxID=2795030 RepID=A0A931ITE2_9BURK|nr:type II secretion system minor pseudopilin GspI [Inhella gelatinilytica]MBH9552412.1 type II secretion system minor pseudopilin GspI [Inhella gelatinilytica]